MDLLIISFVGLLILALIFIAESSKMLGLGLIAGVLFLFLAYWLYGTGIQVMYGQTTISSTCEAANFTCSDTTEIMKYNFANITPTPYVDINNVMAFIFLLCGLYTIVHYALEAANPDR